MNRDQGKVFLITVGILIIVTYIPEILSPFSSYQWLHLHRPFSVAESIDKIAGAALCVVAIWLVRHTDLCGISQELGITDAVLPPVAFALAVSSPMLVGFAFTRSLDAHIKVLPILFRTVLSPMVEELEFRGFGVRQLQRGAGWPLWTAVWPSVRCSELATSDMDRACSRWPACSL